MTTPIKMAILGAGIWAQDTIVPMLLRLSDYFEVTAICSRTRDKAKALAERFPHNIPTFDDMDRMLSEADLEAVMVLLPIHLIPQGVEKALIAGKHVFSEKPIAPELKTGQHLLDLFRKSVGLVWMVGEQYRYEEVFLKAAEVIQSGVLGNLIMAAWVQSRSLSPNNKYYATEWRRNGSYAGGMILDGGVHQIAALRMIVGEVTEVNAAAKQARPDLPPIDTLTAHLTFANGALGVFATTYAAESATREPLVLSGTQGSLLIMHNELTLIQNGISEKILVEAEQGVRRELMAFFEAVRQGLSHRCTPEEALRDVALIEALLESAATGKTVKPLLI